MTDFTASLKYPKLSHNSSFRQEGGHAFQQMQTTAPIRFNPDTPERAPPGTGLGSQSSLSSSMTPESIKLIVKRVTGPSGDSSTKHDSDLKNAMPISFDRTPHLAAAVDGPLATPPDVRSEIDSMIEVSQSPPAGSAPYQAAYGGPKPPGKLTTQYVMPDGSVITGKGLGRGRPGVKRGPRKMRLPGEDSVEDELAVSTQASESATPTSAKRKRADSEVSHARIRSASSSLQSRESSVEYNPTATQTRSGRQTQKPVPITALSVTPSATASPASKKISTPGVAVATPTFKTHPKIKRKVYRGKEQFALCEHCLRGHGPSSNVIVFCDACNKCWHQRCHQPQIPKELIADSKAEWFCATCDKILHGSKKAKKPITKPEVQPAPPPEQKFGPPLVGAIALTIDQRKKYLETLSREQLINLALHAGELAPQMPIFETPIPVPRMGPSLQPQFTSDYVTPVTIIPGANKAAPPDVADEGYDDSYDEHAALYPKTGEGVQLPPERENLNILLEGPDSRTFSHWVKGLPVKTVVDTTPLHLSQPQLPPPQPHARSSGR